jgi:hypothetical protein
MPLNAATLSPQCMIYLDRDALLIHFRVLMDFFFKRDPRRDDILAHHYTRRTPRETPAWHGDFKTKCDKLFAHLTYHRTASRIAEAHHWHEIPDRVNDMQAEITGFLKSLTPERMLWFEVIDA